MTSKRRSERIHTNFSGRMSDRNAEVEVLVTDINAHGMFVRTAAAAALGSIRRFVLALPDGGRMELLGIVRFAGMTVAGYGLGIELTRQPHLTEARWQALYRAMVPDAPPIRMAA